MLINHLNKIYYKMNFQNEEEINFIYCTSFDESNLEFDEKRGTNIPIKYNNDDLMIHLPLLKIPFEVSDVKTKDGKVFMKKITFSTGELFLKENNKKINKHIKKFVKMVQNIDEIAKKYIRQELDEDVNFYSSLYKKEGSTYDPSYNVNITFHRNTTDPIINVFDAKDNKLKLSETPVRQMLASGIVKLDSLWVSKGKAGVNWNLIILQLYNKYKPYITPDQLKQHSKFQICE